MEYLLVVIAITLGTAIGALIYRQGLKDGRPIAEGKELKPLIKAKTTVEYKPNDFEMGLDNILSYTGEKQKDEDDD